ncbi:MAG: hypothetical protein RLZZ342_212 [Candidatus Parcubacteria bacterium]|jgi:cytidylate kinase
MPAMDSEKKRIITLTGLPGSGKSSTANALAKILGYQRFSSGDFARRVATNHGISIEEWNKKAETLPELDSEVDEAVRKAGDESDLVIDSRTAFHWIPQAFKVFLTLDSHIAAERTFKQIQAGERSTQSAATVEELRRNTEERITSEQARYKKLYNLDYMDQSQYNLVVDTGDKTIQGTAGIIADAYRKWLK